MYGEAVVRRASVGRYVNGQEARGNGRHLGTVVPELLSLSPYLAWHWFERHFDASDELGFMFHPGFYIANGRCWLQGVISWWPFAEGEDPSGEGDRSYEASAVFSGLPAKYRPTGSTMIRLWNDTVNSYQGYGGSDTYWDALVSPDGSCVLQPRAGYPKLPTGGFDPVYLVLDTCSWPISPFPLAREETIDLDQYVEDGASSDAELTLRMGQVRASGEHAQAQSDNLYRGNIFSVTPPPIDLRFIPPVTLRKIPLQATDGSGVLTHLTSDTDDWAWSRSSYIPSFEEIDETVFLSTFIDPPTALPPPVPTSLTELKHWYGTDPVPVAGPLAAGGLHAICGPMTPRNEQTTTLEALATQAVGDEDYAEVLLHAVDLSAHPNPLWAGAAYDYAAVFLRWTWHHALSGPTARYWRFEIGFATWFGSARTDHIIAVSGANVSSFPQIDDPSGHGARATLIASLEDAPAVPGAQVLKFRYTHGYGGAEVTTIALQPDDHPYPPLTDYPDEDECGFGWSSETARSGIDFRTVSLAHNDPDPAERYFTQPFTKTVDLSPAVWLSTGGGTPGTHGEGQGREPLSGVVDRSQE